VSRPKSAWIPTALGLFAILLAAGSIFAGFTIVGSPAEARRRKADQQRVNDLSAIAKTLRDMAGKGSDPKKLSDIHIESWRGGNARQDPETRQPYEYRRIDHLNFELCATFETDTISNPSSYDVEDTYSWYQAEDVFKKHRRGRNCFKLSVKPK